jgi:Ubiquinol-cytochrome C reductase hinge protein
LLFVRASRGVFFLKNIWAGRGGRGAGLVFFVFFVACGFVCVALLFARCSDFAVQCKTAWHHYQECAERISSYGTWSMGDLQKEFRRRGEPTADAKNNEFTKEQLRDQIQEVAHCTTQYHHYFECIDRCVIPTLGAQLK